MTERWLAEEYPEEKKEYTGLPPLNDFNGYYRTSRINQTTLEKAGSLFSFTKVSGESRRLFVNGTPYKRTGPYRFIQEKGDGKLLFVQDDNGLPRQMHEVAAINTYLKLRWFETPVFTFILLGAVIVIYITAVGIGIVIFIKRKKSHVSPAPNTIRQTGELLVFISALLGLQV